MRTSASDWKPEQQLASGGDASQDGGGASHWTEVGSTPGGINVGEKMSRSKIRGEERGMGGGTAAAFVYCVAFDIVDCIRICVVFLLCVPVGILRGSALK